MNPELYSGIEVNEGTKSCQIGHKIYGGSLTVYRPERDHFAPSEEKTNGPVIRPGWINASSWNTGGLSPKSAQDVHIAVLALLRIWEIALRVLNEYNSVLADWEPIENPMEVNRDNAKWRENYRQQIVELQSKLDAKRGKKVSK